MCVQENAPRNNTGKRLVRLAALAATKRRRSGDEEPSRAGPGRGGGRAVRFRAAAAGGATAFQPPSQERCNLCEFVRAVVVDSIPNSTEDEKLAVCAKVCHQLDQSPSRRAFVLAGLSSNQTSVEYAFAWRILKKMTPHNA